MPEKISFELLIHGQIEFQPANAAVWDGSTLDQLARRRRRVVTVRTLRRWPAAKLLLALVFLTAGGSGCTESGSIPLSVEEYSLHELGSRIYRVHCRPCHLPEGKSPIERLRFSDSHWNNGNTIEQIQAVVRQGVAATQMRPFGEKLSPEEILAVSQYVKSLSGNLGE
jgi:mono/diheme cytochrome c family protein